ncbi:NFX1-type zinc finger-containing protein 1-like [Homalodisca vitripennis]|uniref:NFX1-type zinc finger-containing protein 1-like n=1 Tax=Homalodisca vitripennis TaxID=197043 RepID=UPI001EE9BE73|nr:NFX1-type zinc finger-containing protein 1-like [Homalodisca vitripennis]
MKTVSIFPTEKDLFGTPELEKNIVEGAYRNVDHYLAVQFRLLREDFMGSLRKGIIDYRRHNSSNDDPEVSFYTQVQVTGSSFIGGGKFGHKIKFNNNVNWADLSKDCKFGSLLLFTTNRFETFFSGTVIDMDSVNSTIMVKFNSKSETVNVCAWQFTVAFPKVYFEPYFHVLNGLQKMAHERFPMEKYIIKVNSRPNPPAYIRGFGPRTYKINGNHYVNVLSTTSWPHLESLKLNPSQHRAFQAALTNEFVAIQGPPGTGKTFLAKQIVATLLDNVEMDTPILVVCYKNQALDQFLEGILEKTKNIIRIGSKSQSEVLENFNIKNHRPKNYGYNTYAKPMERLAAEYSAKQKLLNETISQGVREEMRKIERDIQVLEQKLDDARNSADISVMKKAKVVGMTTSGAARLRPWLNQLGAKIVVIEEAAEVLESHVVTALSSQCQHVILLGDHKQLRPSTEVYELCKKYNLNISLFERMVENGLNCYRLNVQHRMRPEFCSLISPTIYDDLTSHKSTENRQNIPGVSKNLFFVTHNFNERKLPNSVSFRNEHESSFVVQLARYLIMQGTHPEDITVLATYSDQVRNISKMMKQYSETMSMNASTVDDFQGQENKIIILSLVRSNNKRNVGFLKMENRVCVALSRARDGFYIIGNMKLLASNTDIWWEVERSLLKHNAIGNSLSLHCQYHPEIITSVSTGEEIAEIIKKGCNKVCGSHIFRCGHTCRYRCHTADRAHTGAYKCPSHPERINLASPYPQAYGGIQALVRDGNPSVLRRERRIGAFSTVSRAVVSVASAVRSVASAVVSVASGVVSGISWVVNIFWRD